MLRVFALVLNSDLLQKIRVCLCLYMCMYVYYYSSIVGAYGT